MMKTLPAMHIDARPCLVALGLLSLLLFGCAGGPEAVADGRSDCEYRRGVAAAAIDQSDSVDEAEAIMLTTAESMDWYKCPKAGTWKVTQDQYSGNTAIVCSVHGVPGQR